MQYRVYLILLNFPHEFFLMSLRQVFGKPNVTDDFINLGNLLKLSLDGRECI